MLLLLRVFLFVLLLNKILCVCRQSYMTICDNVEDIKDYKQQWQHWTEVIIGSETNYNYSKVDLMNFGFHQLHKLNSLTIINQIGELNVRYAYECTFRNQLKHLNLYGNIISTIKPSSFPKMNYKKLSLVNNRIEKIEKTGFFHHSIENLDLSRNQLEVIENGALTPMDNSKIINLSSNKIDHIEAGSFPDTLESLILDNNNLRQLHEDVLSNLKSLKELSATNNKFKTLPNIQGLTLMKSLDFSYNLIDSLQDTYFDAFPQIAIIDLSHNVIKSTGNFLETLFTPSRNMSIKLSLAFNRFRTVEIGNKTVLRDHTLYFFGNPLDCSSWDQVQEKLKNNQDKCDLEFFTSGKTPYCLNFRELLYYFQALQENDVLRFLEAIKENEKLISCKLSPDKTLKFTISGCVS